MFIETDAKSKPAYYLKKMFATEDYENKAQGGLSFRRGSSVYVLLRNGNGWCTGKILTNVLVFMVPFTRFRFSNYCIDILSHLLCFRNV